MSHDYQKSISGGESARGLGMEEASVRLSPYRAVRWEVFQAVFKEDEQEVFQEILQNACVHEAPPCSFSFFLVTLHAGTPCQPTVTL